MLEIVKEWLPVYTATVTTGLLLAALIILRDVVKSKNATIETLKGQVAIGKTAVLPLFMR